MALNLKVKLAVPCKLTVTRTSNTAVTLDTGVNGVSLTRSDTFGILTSFDCAGVFISSSALGSICGQNSGS